jgi:uncharacterized protein (TIGR03437 family)
MLFRIRGTALVLSLCGLYPVPAQPDTETVYHLTTIAGSDQVGDDGAAVAAQLAQPEGLAMDRAGNLYIADAANHRVRKVSPAGIITTVAGNGHPGFSGDGGPSEAAQLNQPYGLAMDAAGNLYIADFGNQRVRRVGADGVIQTVAGNGERGGAGDGGHATSAQLLGPRNLLRGADGSLYLSEFDGHRVRRIGPDGVIATVAGTGIAGYSGDGGAAPRAQLDSPAGLAMDGAGALYIADTGNARVRKVAAGIISTVCDRARFQTPSVGLSGIAADGAGNLYLPEMVNGFVWRLSPGGALTRVAGAPGTQGASGDGGAAMNTKLVRPPDVMLDAAGNLYISEFARVRRVSALDGTVSTVAGDGTFGFAGEGTSALRAALRAPAGLAFRNGALYIADRGNQRVRKVTADGLIATVAGGRAEPGQADYGGYGGDGLAATSARLNSPAAVAFDAAENLYIADAGNNRVRRVDPGGIIITAAGSGTSGGLGGDGDPAALIPLLRPQGLALDAVGALYIADTGHDRVLRVDGAGTVSTVAGTGSPGYTGDGDTSLALQLHGPAGLALDRDGNLYLADTLNHRVRMLTPGGVLSTAAGTGEAGFSGDGGAAAAAELSYPCAVAVDANRNLFIADSGNNRIRLVTPDGKIATIAGTGEAAYNGEQGAALEIALYNPCGLALDDQGNLLVADTGNDRVRRLAATGTVLPPAPVIEVTLASAASLLPGSLAPGEIFSIFGQGIGPDRGVSGAPDASGMMPASLGDTQVFFDDTPAPLFYVQSGQINAQAPYEVAGHASAQLRIVYKGTTVATRPVSLVDANPALFARSTGTGQAAALNEDGSINSAANPAQRGSIVVLYATGEGQTDPAGVTGRAAQAPFAAPVLPVSLTIAGIPAQILYAGSAPGFAGLMQINTRVPSGFVPPGDLAVELAVGPYRSQAGVTIAVR